MREERKNNYEDEEDCCFILGNRYDPCLSATAFAQTAAPTTPDADNATITIANASKGETYTIYQLFNATVTGTADGSIAYQLMEGKSAEDTGLLEYFNVDASGNVTAKESTNEAVLKSDEFKAWRHLTVLLW